MRTFDEEADSRVCIGKKADEKLQKEMKSERVWGLVRVLQQIEIVKIFEGVSPDAGDTVGIE